MNLPCDIKRLIFTKLDARSIVNLSCVNTEFMKISKSILQNRQYDLYSEINSTRWCTICNSRVLDSKYCILICSCKSLNNYPYYHVGCIQSTITKCKYTNKYHKSKCIFCEKSKILMTCRTII